MALKMESLRLRLEFKNCDILTDAQKSLGLEKSWVLVNQPNSNFSTVAALCDHILHKFQLNQTCPYGLLLSMDGFALPPFVSIAILKDNDVISVQKIDHLTIEGSDPTGKDEEQQVVPINGVGTGTLLLSNEEFDKENECYESEESDDESAEDGNEISKKRKASKKLKSSKKKKQRSEPDETVATGIHRESEHIETPHENEVPSGKKSKSKKGKSSKSEIQTTRGDNTRPDGKTKKDFESASNLKKNEQFQENGEDVDGATTVSGSTQKGPSKSSRRQYAKRIMLREMKKVWKNEDSPSKEVKKLKKRHNKVEKRAVPDQLQNEGSDQPKGLLHLKQFGGKDISKVSSKTEEENQNQKSHGNSNKDNDTSNDVVPVEIRPGHIRFEGLEEDHEVQRRQVSLETFQWNGITSKKKGQKWGTPKASTSRRNDYELKKANLENNCASEWMDFDKFPALPGVPENGDVIAYRLLALSSSWTPEISSYRVGKVSAYNSQSQKIELLPVPEYPVVSKKVDEGDFTGQQDDNIYSKDGSLEIDFTSLVDVRTVKNNNMDLSASTKGIAKHADGGHVCNENSVTSMPLDNNEKCTDSMVKSNGSTNQDNSAQAPSTPENGVDLWEKLSEALNLKKEELSKESNWGKITPSNKNTSSYGAFESSAVCPTSYRGRGRGRNYPTSYRGRGRNNPTNAYRGRGRNYC